MERTQGTGPHAGQPIATMGAALADASAAMIMIHGRGATAHSILELVPVLDRPDFAYLAPQATGNTWYPYSFLAPIEQNQPWLDSALSIVGDLVAQVLDAGVAAERVMLLGFSQGACLTLEFSARNPQRYGGIAALTGGLIGPDGTPRDYTGSFDGAPVFIGTSDPDPHVPLSRVDETVAVLERMDARVTKRVYPGMPHTVNKDEIVHVRALMDALP